MDPKPQKSEKRRPAAATVVLVLATLAIFLFNMFMLAPWEKGGTGADAETAPAKKEISLSFGAAPPFLAKESIEAFEAAHPDIRINLVVSSASPEYQYTQYKTDFFSRTRVADVMLIEMSWLDEFASQGWLLPLSNYYSGTYMSRFIPVAAGACRYEGSLYALPATVDMPVLYYRSDLIPRPPQSYDEMVKLAQQVLPAQNMKYAYVSAAQAYDSLVCMASEFLLAGANPIVQEGEVTLAAPAANLGLDTMFRVLMANPNPIDVFSFTDTDAQIAFAQGDALFMRSGLSACKVLGSGQSAVKGKFATIPLPVAEAGRPGLSGAGTFGGWQYVINRGSKRPDEAAMLIDFLVGDDNQRQCCEEYGTPPTLLACYQDVALVSLFSDLPDVLSAYGNAWLRPKTSYYMEISTQIAPEFARFIRGYSTTNDTIENLRQVLKRYFVLN